jgi:hypothetical protein
MNVLLNSSHHLWEDLSPYCFFNIGCRDLGDNLAGREGPLSRLEMDTNQTDHQIQNQDEV